MRIVQPAHLTEQPDPVAALGAGHPPQVRQVTRVHREDQVPLGQPGRPELPSPVRRAVVAAPGQRGPCARVHRLADMPVPRASAVHGDRAAEPGLGERCAQHRLGHG